ncbi:MAG: hypothetical protein Q8S57_00045 [Methanoregula sp.]|nr:hypothetical protein [Methanoregula sp.]
MNFIILTAGIIAVFIVIELTARCIYYFRKHEIGFSRKVLLVLFGRWLISEYPASSIYIKEIAASLGVDTGFMISTLSEASGKTPDEIRKIFLDTSGGQEAYQLSPMTGFIPLPDQNLAHIHTNSKGFRGSEVPLKKGPGVKRVLLLGGSVAFGRTATSDNTTIASHLEIILNNNKDLTFKGRWEVINLAVPDFITYQELVLLVNTGLAYEPDIVVSLTGFNDAHHYLATEMLNSPASMRSVATAYNAFFGGILHRLIAFLGMFLVSVQFAGRIFRGSEQDKDEELSPFIYTIW